MIASFPYLLDNLAFDSHDRLFVSSLSDGSIFEVHLDEIDPSKRTRAVSKGGMIFPGGVAVVPRSGGESSVFVADVWSLREFKAQTGQQMNIEHDFLVDPSGLTFVFTVSPDGDNLVLSSYSPPQV